MISTADKNKPIGVFDSGVGGLTVLKELYKYLPHESFIYFGDLASIPYGSKSNDFITEHSYKAFQYLNSYGVKCIVTACNTASSIALPQIEQLNLQTPVIGVLLPGAKYACTATQNGYIAVLATQATILSQSYESAIHNINHSLHVSSIACPLLVPIVEAGWNNEAITSNIIKKYIDPLFNVPNKIKPDCLVLGCTHFPVLTKTFENILPSNVTIIDSAITTAKETKQLLIKHDLINVQSNTKNPTKFFLTDTNPQFISIAKNIIKIQPSPKDIKIINIP